MKRVIAVSVVLVFAVSALFATGPAEAEVVKPVDILFWAWPSAGVEFDMIEEFVAWYNENNDMQVTVTYQAPEGDYAQALVTAFAAGNAPDVYFGANQSVFDLGLAENLTPLINSDPEVDPNDLLELSLNFFRLRQDPNEDVYGLSVGWTTNLLFYNKTLFQEMGVENPAVQYANGRWDRSAFFEAAQALTSDSDGDGINDTFGYELGTWFANMDFFIGANGLDSIYDPDTNRLLYDDPRIREAYEFVHDSMYEWKIMPTPSDEHASFNLGKVGMFIAGNWTIGRLEALEADWEWGVTMPPKWDRYYTNFRSNGIALSSRTDYQAQAWDVLKEFALGYGTVLRAKYEFSFPANQSGFDLQTGVDPIWVESLQYASVPAQHLRWAEIRQIIQKYHAFYWQDPDADYSEMATSILRDSDEIFAED